MGEEGAVLFFKGRAGTFTVQADTWVSLKSKEVSIQTIPAVGPCLFTHHSSDNLDITQFVLKPKIKAKSTESAGDWIFKAGRLHENKMAKPNILAVRLGSAKAAMRFKDAYVTAFEEWNNSDWACRVCTVRNNSNVSICEICNTGRLASRKISTMSPPTDAESQQENSPSGSRLSLSHKDVLPIRDIEKWDCKWCSFLNSYQTNICIICKKTKQKGWTCNLCTYENTLTNEKCAMCDADSHSLIFRAESSSKLQKAANYILHKHPDGILCFKTLQTICGKLYTRVEKYRVLWVQHTAVQKKLVSFDGAMDFLRLLGFNLDKGQQKFVCKLEDPEESLLDEAMEILEKVIESLERPNGSALGKTSKTGVKKSSSRVKSPRLSLPKQTERNSIESNWRCSELSAEPLPPCSREDSELSELPPDNDDCKLRKYSTRMSSISMTPGFFSTMHAIKELGEGMESDIDEWLDKEEKKEDEEVTSLHNLVYWLTKERDDVGNDVLLLVHRTFSSSEKLLEVLIERFDKAHLDESEESEIDKIRRHVMQFCFLWVSQYNEDFELQSPVYDRFQWFLQQAIKANQCRKIAAKALDHLKWNEEIEEDEDDLPSLINISSASKSSKFSKPSFRNDWTVTVFTVREVAELTTLLDYEKFKQINHRELLNQAWKKKDREKKSPNLLNMIARYNRVCKWTQIAILNSRGIEQRQKTLIWFIKLAKHLIRIKNYNSAWAVNSALNSTPIYKLKHTWSGISKKQKECFDYHSKLFKASGNYRLLRKEMEALQPPAIPQIGVLLKDLVSTDVGFLLKGTETGYEINFQKCRKLAERITNGFGRFQKQDFEFEKNEMVLNWLTSTQDKLSEVQDSFLLELSDQVRKSDAKEKSKRFWS